MLFNNSVEMACADKIKQDLAGLRDNTLKELCIDYECALPQDFAKLFYSAVQNNISLKNLILNNKQIANLRLAIVVLELSKSLLSFVCCLRHESLSDAEACALAGAIQINRHSHLQSLTFNAVGLSNTGALVLLKALINNFKDKFKNCVGNTLYINFSNNIIDDRGACSIERVLRDFNKFLSKNKLEIFLSGNQISEVGATVLGEIQERNLAISLTLYEAYRSPTLFLSLINFTTSNLTNIFKQQDSSADNYFKRPSDI